MYGFTATTDHDWYTYLCTRPDFDEVNFWAPSGRAALGTVPYGSPFFFKLKSPHNAIGGFGFLGPIATVPLSLAWEAFGQKNGAPDLPTMAARIRRYRRGSGDEKASFDPPVGCRTILQPVFFSGGEWVQSPADWSPNIVQGKTYDLTHGEGPVPTVVEIENGVISGCYQTPRPVRAVNGGLRREEAYHA